MSFFIEYGSSSDEVEDFQKRLIGHGFKIRANGTFDDATLDAVNQLAAKGGYSGTVKHIDDSYMRMLKKLESTKYSEIKVGNAKLAVETDTLRQLTAEQAAKVTATLAPAVAALRELKIRWASRKEQRDNNVFWLWAADKLNNAKFPSDRGVEEAIKGLERLIDKGAKMTLTPADVKREMSLANKVFKEIADYQKAVFGNTDSSIKNMEDLSTSMFALASICMAFATAGSSVALQAAAAGGVSGFKEASKQVASYVGQPSAFHLADAAANIIFAASIDALAAKLIKGPQGASLLKEAEKLLLKGGSSAISSYLSKVLINATPGMIADALKSIPDVMNGEKKVTLGTVAKAIAESLLVEAGAQVLGPIAEKYTKPLADDVLIAIMDNSAAKRPVDELKKKGARLFLEGTSDKSTVKAISSAATSAAKVAVSKVLAGWKPSDDPKKFEATLQDEIGKDAKLTAAIKKAAEKRK